VEAVQPPVALAERAAAQFAESAALKSVCAEQLAAPIAAAAQRLAQALAAGGKVLACGNGGSAADAQHFAAELVGRFEGERRPLAALSLATDTSALTAIANDYGYEQVFARQVEALGRPGDVLVAISTSGRSPSVVAAVRAAQRRGLAVVALTGRGGGELARALAAGDVLLCVPHEGTARIQEVHILMLHCLCELVEQQLGAGAP